MNLLKYACALFKIHFTSVFSETFQNIGFPDQPSQTEAIISIELLSVKLNRSVSDLSDAVCTMFFCFDKKFLNRVEERRHGLDPIGFVEPHAVHYENTFVYFIGRELFKSVHDVSTRMYFIELMILCLEECQVSSVPEIRSRPI
ncbi:hypothetical protein RF11_02795 [Thelohanellus kitauei]|uniref:Uncharacterized protein n=1 Tax=Thelohanellus kitauei TaxID=669202 RepID=A0A0C2N0G6_THEKT|nr:hypothetical protein RF11_02795 [Thelohanellus kitauei]